MSIVTCKGRFVFGHGKQIKHAKTYSLWHSFMKLMKNNVCVTWIHDVFLFTYLTLCGPPPSTAPTHSSHNSKLQDVHFCTQGVWLNLKPEWKMYLFSHTARRPFLLWVRLKVPNDELKSMNCLYIGFGVWAPGLFWRTHNLACIHMDELSNFFTTNAG